MRGSSFPEGLSPPMNTRLPSKTAPETPDRMELIARARQSVLGGETVPLPWLHPWIERSWRRCLGMGLQPRQRLLFEAVSASAMQRAIEANQPLLRAAAPVIRSLARAMADTRYFAILTDAQGMVIDVNGPVDRQDPRASAIARVGVDLSEKAVGTTAIGATLAEGLPVWLHRGEHFFDDTSVYSCAGAPLFAPSGRCIGMLDLTGINVPERPALKHLVTQSARSIENALTLAQPHHMLLRLNWPGRVLGEDSDGLVCVDDEGKVTGTNRAAADMLALTPEAPCPHCGDVFAVPPGSLFDAARAQRGTIELPLWSGLRMQVLARLRSGVHGAPARHTASQPAVPLKEVEAALIRKAVEDARGNVMAAARALGISRATVYRKLIRKKTAD